MPQLLAVRPDSVPAASPAPADRIGLRVPKDLAGSLRARAGGIARELVAAVAREVPEYTEPLDGPLGPIVTATLQTVVQGVVDEVLDPRAPRQDWSGICDCVGSSEFGSGRPLETLQRACKVAEQTLAQIVAVHIRRYGASLDLARLCAAAVAERIRTLAAMSARAYQVAQAECPRPDGRSRRELLDLMLAEGQVEGAALEAAARAARWPLPDAVCVVALRPPSAGEPLRADLADEVLVGEDVLVVDATVPVLAELAPALPGWRIAVGPAAPVSKARESLRVARRAIDLADRGLLPGHEPLDCVQHQATLTLFADEFVLSRLVELRLAPLDGLTERQRERMLVTLHEWLVTRGQANEIAERLGVHPQTVRYRLKKLEEYFGDQLSDAQRRFELTLATRAMLLGHSGADEEVA